MHNPRKFAIEELRGMVSYFNNLYESFNTRYTHEELYRIYRFMKSEDGGIVHEMADHWPMELLDAVVKAEAGAKIRADIVKRASEAAA